jgi:hypothetical protein
MEPPPSRGCSILLILEKVNELGRPGKHNATKRNNAWWRWIRSGQRNPPVISKTADIHRDRLFKIAHFPTQATGIFKLGHCRW